MDSETLQKTSLIKPTIDTPLHIDFEWWRENDSNWRIFLLDFLCEKHRESFMDLEDNVLIDVIDPESGEVAQVDGLSYELMNHCAKQEGFITDSMVLTSRIFRIFLAKNNSPLSPKELQDMLNRPAQTILTMLTGPQVYKGIRPIRNS